jgi:hypothetical protein
MPSDQPTREPNQILARLVLKIGIRVVVAIGCFAVLLYGLNRYVLPDLSPLLETPQAAPHENTTVASGATAATATQAEGAPPPASPAATTTPLVDTESRTLYTVSEATRAATKSDQRWFVVSADEAKEILEEARRLAEKFGNTIATLKTDDQGRRIAARTELLARYRALASTERTPAGRIAAALDDLESVAAPFRRALSDPDDVSRPDDPQRRKVAEFRLHAGTYRDEYRKLDAELETLLADLLTVREAADDPLATVVAGVEAEEARESSRLTAEAREAARKAAAKTRADAEAEAIRIAAETEAAEIVGKAQAEKARKDAALAEAKDAAEKERLRKKSKGPEVREILGVFLARGYQQPKEIQGTFLAFEATPEPHPLSLTKLRTLGALDEGIKGLQTLVWIASERQNDRPRWNFTPHAAY